MRNLYRFMFAAIAAVAFALQPGAARAHDAKQIQLTDKQIEGYLAALKEMPKLTENPDAKARAELDIVAKKNGFADFQEFDDVMDNIGMVVDGIDPKTKAFTEPADMIKQEIAKLRADKSIPEKDKQAALKEMNEALKTAQPIQFRGNIDLVKKYFDKLQPTQ